MDRAIVRDDHLGTRGPDSAHFTVSKSSAEIGLADSGRRHLKHIIARLAVLQRMGLAEPAGANTWHVRQDFEEILKAMQRTADRQKTLAAHGVAISDHRLPIEVLDIGTDAKVHYIPYTPEMELHTDGGLRTHLFLRYVRWPQAAKLC